MTLTELRYIVALAQARHFGRAAEQCHVSQPTLSVGVKKLEEDLGVLIFERSKSAVRITPVGEALLPKPSVYWSKRKPFESLHKQAKTSWQHHYGSALFTPLALTYFRK